MSPVFAHTTTGSVLYVGNEEAACDHGGLLREHNIRHIVNCRAGRSKKPHSIDRHGKSETFHFSVENYWRFCFYDGNLIHEEQGMTSQRSTCPHGDMHVRLVDSNAGTLAFFFPVFEWIWNKLSQGHNVLVHCLVGAHRAGTTAVGFVMWRQWMNVGTCDVLEALRSVKERRLIVDPLGGFATLLCRLEAAFGTMSKGAN